MLTLGAAEADALDACVVAGGTVEVVALVVEQAASRPATPMTRRIRPRERMTPSMERPRFVLESSTRRSVSIRAT
jgi:hypothetical protein